MEEYPMTPLRQRMIEDLRVRGLSPNTIDSYVGAVARYARHFGRSPEQLGKEDIRSFQVHLTVDRKVAASTLNIYTSALRFLYTVTLGKDWDIKTIPYARTPQKIPTVLRQDEVLCLFAAIANLKHRVISMTIYAAGLRVSEVASLRPCDIDSRRMLIHVRQGKGGKDRLVPLSEALLGPLREYYLAYRPEHWLFPGQDPTRHINPRSVHRVLSKAAEAAIGRRISPHVLRHTCATHLLEAGVNIRVVQGFLGHCRLSTTDRYSHVTREQITATKSPLDLIAEAG
jgi:integrase/recombinase XerD